MRYMGLVPTDTLYKADLEARYAGAVSILVCCHSITVTVSSRTRGAIAVNGSNLLPDEHLRVLLLP